MAIWIPEYLVKNKTYTSDDQTLYIDLPKNEQISHLSVEVSATNAAQLRTTTLIDAIDKYEVMADGSKVLYSLEPELAYYIDFVISGGLYPPMGFNFTHNARCTHEFVIPFGRYLFDEQYLLDTSLYNDCQLRIPYDISDTDVHNSGSFRLNLVMWRPLEKLRPVGFIRSRTVKKETSGNAVETIDHALPMTFPLRYVATRFEAIDANIQSGCTAIKVNIDEGRLILADLNINEWMDQDKRRYPNKNYYKIMAGWEHEQFVKAHTNYPAPRSIVSSGVRALIFVIYEAAGEQLALEVYEEDGSVAGMSHALDCLVTGPHPHKCLTIIDGRDEPFDVSRYSQGKIEYTLAEDVTILHTFVQEVVAGRLA